MMQTIEQESTAAAVSQVAIEPIKAKGTITELDRDPGGVVVAPMLPATYDFAPKDLTEAMKLADMLASSTMVPKDFQGKPGNCFIAMQMGHELGLKPIQSLQSIAVINGRPAVWGDALLALVIGSGVCDYVREPTPNTEEGVCIVKRKGQLEVTRRFTAEDAQRAGLLKKDIWQQYRPRMLQMRARAFALRDVFPDVLKGLPIAEEVRDYVEPEKDVTETSTTVEPTAKTKSAKLAEGLSRVKIEQVITAFGVAKDAEAIKAAVVLAQKLKSDPDKELANVAYHDALERLRRGAGPSYEEVRSKLAAATHIDQLDAAESLVDGLNEPSDIKAALHADAKVVREEFTKE
jgi:hypothetical protein